MHERTRTYIYICGGNRKESVRTDSDNAVAMKLSASA